MVLLDLAPIIIRVGTRVAAINRLRPHIAGFNRSENTRRALIKLFRFSDWRSLQRAHAYGDEKSAWLDAKLKLLGSEHGWAIYKALVERLK